MDDGNVGEVTEDAMMWMLVGIMGKLRINWNDGDIEIDVDDYPLRMKVLYGLGDGVEHGAGLPLREELLSEDLIQQLPSFKQLRHQENRAAVVVHLQDTEMCKGQSLVVLLEK